MKSALSATATRKIGAARDTTRDSTVLGTEGRCLASHSVGAPNSEAAVQASGANSLLLISHFCFDKDDDLLTE
jgi:hypothetical protein